MPTLPFAPEAGVLLADPIATAAIDRLPHASTAGEAPEAETWRPRHRRALPAIGPGELWLVEWPPGQALGAAEQKLIEAANVVVYDRSLAAAVAAALPLGGYAEPALGEAAIDRCVRFARDGWSVVRLIGAGTQRGGGEIRAFAARLRGRGIADEPTVRLFADSGDSAGMDEASLRDLDAILEGERDHRLIVAFSGVAAGGVSPLGAVVANGLAG